MIRNHNPNDDVLVTPVRTADAKAVPLSDDAIRLRRLTVDVDLAALTGALGFRPGFKQTRDIKPDIQSNLIAHRSFVLVSFAVFVRFVSLDQNFDGGLRVERPDEVLRLLLAMLVGQFLLKNVPDFVQ